MAALISVFVALSQTPDCSARYGASIHHVVCHCACLLYSFSWYLFAYPGGMARLS